MSTASRWQGWVRRTGSTLGVAAGPMAPAGEATSDPIIEIFVDESWMDVSAYVRYSGAVNITRGTQNEQTTLQASRCTFTLGNNDGRFSPRNPRSPLYGKIGRNTRVRVSVLRSGTRFYRFYGEISSWPRQSDISGSDRVVNIEASGVTRRLTQGEAPLNSVMYRSLTRFTPDNLAPVVAYWPMEDGSGATSIASATPGVSAMQIIGTPTLATNSDFVASDALPTVQSGMFTATIPKVTSTNEIAVRFLMKIPSGGTTTNSVIAQVFATGDIARWELYYTTASSGSLGMRAIDGDGATVSDSGVFTYTTLGYNGLLFLISMRMEQNGTSIDWGWTSDRLHPIVPSSSSASGTSITSSTTGRATSVLFNPAQASLGDTVLGHLSVFSEVDLFDDLSSRAGAYAGEYSSPRLVRLCLEEELSFTRLGSNSTQMGPQLVKTLVSLLQECADTDLGILYEARDYLGYKYRDRSDMRALTDSLVLDHSAHELSAALIPVDDDQSTRNDITLTNGQGSSYRAVLDDGSLSVNDPPDGIGKYDVSMPVSLYRDSQLPDHAYWRLHLGTVDQARYPSISINLKHSAFADYADLAQVLALDIGQRISITNPPDSEPPEDIALLVVGYTERFTVHEHIMTLNCVPALPLNVAVYDADRYGTAGSALTSDADGAASTLSVTTTLGPVWTQAAADFPFDVMVGGEQVTVTNISGSTSPQTFTVTRSVNGIVKNQTAGTQVSLFTPAVRGLAYGETDTTYVYGRDFPPAVYVSDNTLNSNLTSTAYAVLSPELGVYFTAPSSGNVLITVGGGARDNTNDNRAFLAAAVYANNADASSAVEVAPVVQTGGFSIPGNNANYMYGSRSFMVEDLTPGADYYARIMVSAEITTSASVDITNRDLIVEPVP